MTKINYNNNSTLKIFCAFNFCCCTVLTNLSMAKIARSTVPHHIYTLLHLFLFPCFLSFLHCSFLAFFLHLAIMLSLTLSWKGITEVECQQKQVNHLLFTLLPVSIYKGRVSCRGGVPGIPSPTHPEFPVLLACNS